MKKYIIKNENKIKVLEGGFKKDNLDGKIRIDVIPYNMIVRIGKHFTDGAKKYGMDNWKKAKDMEQAHIFKEAAMRHMWQWNEGMEDEDHASAVIQNIMMYEWHKEKNEKK